MTVNLLLIQLTDIMNTLIYKDGCWLVSISGQIVGLSDKANKRILIAFPVPRSPATIQAAKDAVLGTCLVNGGFEVYAVFLSHTPPPCFFDDGEMKAFLSRLLAATAREIDSVDDFPIMSLN